VDEERKLGSFVCPQCGGAVDVQELNGQIYIDKRDCDHNLSFAPTHRQMYPQSTMLEDVFFVERQNRGLNTQELTGPQKAIQTMIETVEHYEHGNAEVSDVHAGMTIEGYAAVVHDLILAIMGAEDNK
jgi:ABC-type uncharacterized transport system ATPase subunit